MRSIRVIDSHTEGEPTRVVVDGGPELPDGDLALAVQELKTRFPRFHSSIVCEPRGHEAIVGALLLPPIRVGSAASVIYFNNAGYLTMCGHGTIGVVRTLQHLGRIEPGPLTLDTTAGAVGADLHGDGKVTIRNVPSYRHRAATVEVPGYGSVTGDVAYGGNWFFLTPAPCAIDLGHYDELQRYSSAIRRVLDELEIRGENGGVIDHIELTGPPVDPDNDARNYVLCPGLAYDRSPCGTGTSAKLACLAADAKLGPGQIWRQESVIGSVFEGSYEPAASGRITPFITGAAYITAESTLMFDEDDPFRDGIGGALQPFQG